MLYEGITGRLNVIGRMNKFASLSSRVYSAFKRVKTVLDAADAAFMILELAQADWARALPSNADSECHRRDFAKNMQIRVEAADEIRQRVL
jgi:hypothetical protein